ncbi:MAG TPA: hypothetical protein VGA51_12085 [Casimicrobiaceae bacterium]
MKRFVAAMAIGAILTAIYPASAIAQAQKSAPGASAAPVPPTAAPVPPTAAPVSPAAEKRAPSRVTRVPWTRADARVCLEFSNNVQIVKCAEKYRYTRVPA